MRGTRLLVFALLLVLPACGGGAATPGLGVPGTLTLANASNLGQAPETITSFVFVPQGTPGTPPNLLTAPLPPGGIVIVGLFPEGVYDGAAVLGGGQLIPFNNVVISSGAPTTLTFP